MMWPYYHGDINWRTFCLLGTERRETCSTVSRDHFLTKRLPRIQRMDRITTHQEKRYECSCAQQPALCGFVERTEPGSKWPDTHMLLVLEFVPSFCSQELKIPGAGEVRQLKPQRQYCHVMSKYIYFCWEKWLKRSNVMYNKMYVSRVVLAKSMFGVL